ncbi:hypothetical protein MHYP_G00140740 [Metynnis hypsauchen]
MESMCVDFFMTHTAIAMDSCLEVSGGFSLEDSAFTSALPHATIPGSYDWSLLAVILERLFKPAATAKQIPSEEQALFSTDPTTTSPTPHTAPGLQGDPAVKPGCEGVRRLKRSSRQEQSLPVNIYYEQRHGQAKHCHPDLE